MDITPSELSDLANLGAMAEFLGFAQPILILVLSLLGLGLFSTIEQIILSLGTLRAKNLKQIAGREMRSVKVWIEHPSRILAAVVMFESIATVLVVYGIMTASENFAINFFTRSISFLISVLMIVIFGEVIPRALTKAFSDSALLISIRFAYGLFLLAMPLIIGMTKLQHWFAARFGAKEKEHPPISEEEIEYLLQLGQRTGVLEETKKDMIEGVFEFDETKVREIMTPRLDIKWIPVTSSFSQALEASTESEMSRIPICGAEGIDHVVGILLAKDLLKLAKEFGKPHQRKISDIMREPFFIPESKPIMDVFKDLKKNKSHMAIVVDEHGGTAGLVTMEDILEEIVGDIQDEFDTEEADIVELEQGIFDVAGSCHIDEFIAFFEIKEGETTDYSDEGIDTIGGYFTATLGELPEVGKTLKIGSLNLEVSTLDRNRIKRLRVSKILAPSSVSSEVQAETFSG